MLPQVHTYLPPLPFATRLPQAGQFLCCSKILYTPKSEPNAANIVKVSMCLRIVGIVVVCVWLLVGVG